MKLSTKCSLAMMLLAGYASLQALDAAPKTKPEKTNSTASIFVMPSNPTQGRDPFFPQSDRPYETAAASAPRSASLASLQVKGFSGTMAQRLVIINNHTFAVGDEGDVTTSAGRIHVRCVDIKTNSVIIEADGQYHEILYTP